MYGVANNPPLFKVLSGSGIKPFTWKHCLIYSNSWEVLSVVPVSNERGRTNSWQGIFLLHSSAYNYTLTNRVWCTCMVQFAMNHILNKLQTTVMQLNRRLSCILCLCHERSKQICVLYFHPEAKSRTSHFIYSTHLYFICTSICIGRNASNAKVCGTFLLQINIPLHNLSYLCFPQPQCQQFIAASFLKIYNHKN